MHKAPAFTRRRLKEALTRLGRVLSLRRLGEWSKAQGSGPAGKSPWGLGIA